MALKTTTEQLESVQAAIEEIEQGAQSFTTSLQESVAKAKLKTLYEREEVLRNRLAKENELSEIPPAATVDFSEVG